MVRLLSFVLLVLSSCSTTYVIYEVGRPKSVEENNARRIAAKEFQVTFEYSSSTNTDDLEKIQKHNDSITQLLNSKYSTTWEDDLVKLALEELALQNSFRNDITKLSIYEQSINDLFEPQILFEKKKNDYKAYIIGQRKNDDSRSFIIYALFFIDSISEEIKILSEKTNAEINPEIAFPQNGIE